MGRLFRQPSNRLILAVICVSLFLAGQARHALAFEQPLPADREVTLEECVAYALGTHPKIKGAEQDLRAGVYRTKEAISAFWPQVAFQASRNYRHFATTAQQVGLGSSTTTSSSDVIVSDFNFNTSWVLFDFGQTYFNVRTQAKLEDALTDDLTTSQQTVAYNVRDAYFNLLRTQTLLKVANETLEQANSHLKQAQAFYEVGTKPKFDVTSAEVEVNDAKLQVIQAEDSIKTARVTLNTRIGIDALTPLNVQDRPELEKMEKPIEEYMKIAMKNRPELMALEERMHAAEMTVNGAYAAFMPTVSATAIFDLNKTEHTDLVDNENLQLTFSVPLFDGFLRHARVGETRAAMLSARYQIEDQKNDVALAVGQFYLRAVDAKTRTETLVASVTKAKENLEIAQGRYEAGVAQIIEVTDARTSLTQAETNLAQAYYDYHLAFSGLMRSIGASPVEHGVVK